MAFELQTRPVPAKLSEAFPGATVELRELTWRVMRDAMREGGARDLASEGLLAASLHVDGEPIGLDTLLSIPGRYAGALGLALMSVHQMHGLMPEDDEPADAESNDAPKH